MPNEIPDKSLPQKIFHEANKNQDIPKIYSNAFSCSIGTGDVVILFQRAEVPVGMVNMSYTVAKTLAIKLQGLITFLEQKSGKSIMTTDDINKYLAEPREDNEAIQ